MDTLRQLTAEYMELLEMAADPACDPETIADTLEAIGGEIEMKGDSYAVIITELQSKLEMVDAEVKRLTAWKGSIKNNIDRLKKNLEDAMRVTGKMKFKTDLHSYSIQKNPASLAIDANVDMDIVPPEFIIFAAPTIDKKAVKEAIKAGQEFEWAHMEQSESLRIR